MPSLKPQASWSQLSDWKIRGDMAVSRADFGLATARLERWMACEVVCMRSAPRSSYQAGRMHRAELSVRNHRLAPAQGWVKS